MDNRPNVGQMTRQFIAKERRWAKQAADCLAELFAHVERLERIRNKSEILVELGELSERYGPHYTRTVRNVIVGRYEEIKQLDRNENGY